MVEKKNNRVVRAAGTELQEDVQEKDSCTGEQSQSTCNNIHYIQVIAIIITLVCMFLDQVKRSGILSRQTRVKRRNQKAFLNHYLQKCLAC